jgi:pimeloyl-ACP methyl ester carboxylesterase
LVLLHGNGSMIQDFESSGLIDLAAKSYRVIVFDRPGFGHSDRPRSVVWTPAAQAELINSALHRLSVSEAIVLGHSWGATVAVALALKYPTLVQGLVLASGYYYPTFRPDVVALSAPAVPFFGDALRYTLSPIVSRLMWPLAIAKIFGPQAAPQKFVGFPKGMALRPSQIRASAAESALMVPDAFYFRNEYANLKMPVVIVAGEQDRLVDIDSQSARLYCEVRRAAFIAFPEPAIWSIRLRPTSSCLPSTKWTRVVQQKMTAQPRPSSGQSARPGDELADALSGTFWERRKWQADVLPP